MKKLFYWVCVLLAATTIAACSSNDDFYPNYTNGIEVNNVDNFDSIKSRIITLGTKDLGYNRAVITRGEKWKRFWTGVRDVLLADAEGAADGLAQGEILVHSVSASFKKAVSIIKEGRDSTTHKGATPGTSTPSGIVSCNPNHINDVKIDPSTGCMADSVGILHNAIISGAISDHPSMYFWEGLTKEQFVDTLCEETKKVLGDPSKPILTEAQRIDVINSLDNYTSNETPEETISRITSNNPKLGGTLDVVLEYINQLYKTDSFEEGKKYSEEVIGIIDNSDLSEDDKASLRLGVSVAFASANLWNKE